MLFILILQSKSNYDLFKVAPSKQNLKIPPGHRSLTASLQGCLNVPDWGSALLLPTGNASGKTGSRDRRSEGCWVVGGSWQSPLWPTEQTSCSMAEPGGSPSDCPLQSRKETTLVDQQRIHQQRLWSSINPLWRQWILGCFSPFYINFTFWTIVMFKPFMGCVLFGLNVCVFTIYMCVCYLLKQSPSCAQFCLNASSSSSLSVCLSDGPPVSVSGDNVGSPSVFCRCPDVWSKEARRRRWASLRRCRRLWACGLVSAYFWLYSTWHTDTHDSPTHRENMKPQSHTWVKVNISCYL